MSSPMHPIVWVDDAGWKFQGNLDAGKKWIAREDCTLVITPMPCSCENNEHGFFIAEISEPGQPDEMNEYGHAPTEDEAVRYAIGAYFGGIDRGDGPDAAWESRIIALLQVIHP